MDDAFNRDITYLRISVTDRCNLRCSYCMPEKGVSLIDHEQILSLEEIAKLVRAAVLTGIRKIRLTGGEPLVRKGLLDLIDMIRGIPEIEDISMTTNGILLSEMARDLKKAGLDRVNISLDTILPEKFERITRGGQVSKVWMGIETALEEGLKPVKINTVVIKGFNDDEVLDFASLTTKMPLNIRFIELMPIGAGERLSLGGFMAQDEIKEIVERSYTLEPVDNMHGFGPAVYHKISGAQGTIGFITAISQHFCSVCNRLRLTADGKLRPCLWSANEIDLKTPLRQGANEQDLAEYIKQGIKEKPKQHEMSEHGWAGNTRIMNQIGG